MYEIPSRNSAGSAITTPVAIFRYEQDNFRGKIRIKSLEFVKHIVQQQIASTLSIRNSTKNPGMR